MPANSVYLEVDSSLTEDNLKLVRDDAADEFQKFLSGNEGEYPSKFITPYPGICVKTKDELGGKFFVNLCHCNEIPEPPSNFLVMDVDELLGKDPSEFRVPMSIGQIRSEQAPKGGECRVCDVAVNTKFFKRIENITGWKNFVLTIIFEALKEKYQVDCLQQSMIILQNRKHVGALQRHKIQDREMAKEMGITDLPKPPKEDTPKIEMLSSTDYDARCPEYRLFKKKSGQNRLIGEFKFPDVVSADELKLDVGEDRIIIECEERNYMLDIFVPLVLRPESTNSVFDKATKILTVTMPLVGG